MCSVVDHNTTPHPHAGATPVPATGSPKAGVATPEHNVESAPQPVEHGGPKGLEPTRYGDWERKGRCIDF